MDLKDAATHIQTTLNHLEQAMGQPVFDEWILVRKEGGAWTQVALQKTVSSYPVIDDSPAVNVRPNNFGCNYIHLNNPGGDEDQLEVSYDGPQTGTTANVAELAGQGTGNFQTALRAIG